MPVQQQTELEVAIIEAKLRETGFPASGLRYATSAADITDIQKVLLRRWLIAQGAPENAVISTTSATLSYLWNTAPVSVRNFIRENERKPKTVRRGVQPADIDLGGFAPNETSRGVPVSELLGTKPQSQEVDNTGDYFPPVNEPRPIPSSGFDAAAIARAAEAVIKPRIDAAKEELNRTHESSLRHLKQELANHVSSEVQRIKATLSDDDRRQIREMVDNATASAIARLVPRQLEIKVANKPSRLLPAEPHHKVFDEVFSLLSSGEHVYLVGNAGTGKTHLFKQLAVALNRPVTILGQALTKYEFSGHIGPTGEYVKTLLRTAVEDGHLLAIDEIDMSAAAAIGFLNSLTANRYVAFPDRMVDAHPDFVVIAAANTYGRGATAGFIGRNPLDAASLDRFSYVECGYDEDLETQIYGNSSWLQYVHRVRHAIEALSQRHIVSMRAIERGLRCLAIGMTAERVCEVALWRGLEPDVVSKIKAQAGEFQLQQDQRRKLAEHFNGDRRPSFTKLDEFKSYIENRELIRAIKLWRQVTNEESLTNAKNMIESIRDGLNPFPTFEDHVNWSSPA
jgi:cobaltochelatase CobS